MFFVVLVFFVSLFYYFNFRSIRKPLYKLSNSLPGVGNLPVIGHTHWFIGGPEKIYQNLKKLSGLIEDSGGVSKLWIGPNLYYASFNLDDVQNILEHSLKKDYVYKFLRPWLGNGLFVAPVGLWKAHRRILAPIFHSRLLEDYLEVFGRQASVMVDKLKDMCGKQEFDIYSYVSNCMLDIVFETSLGEHMKVQEKPDTPYLRARSSVMSIINMRLFKAWMQPDALFNLTAYAKIQSENIKLTHKFTDEVVKKKRETLKKNGYVSEGRKDLLTLLLQGKNNFNDVQLREHIDSITIAGNDTTALVISYTLLLLGCHLEEQDKVFEELQEIFGDSTRTPTKDDLTKMHRLERAIKESMRLYTVVPIIARETDEEIKLSNCSLPPGVGCVLLAFAIHRSKKIWGDDADCFKPDRFLPENSVGRHPCAFIPFSHGTRNCIGRHFGMLSMKSILASVLRTYQIKGKPTDRLKIEIILYPVDGHLITLEKRTKK